MRFSLLLALLIFFGSCFALEAPTKNKNAETPKQVNQFSAPERGTESNPFFVKAIPTQKSQSETDHEAYEHYEKPNLDRWLTGGTIALVVVTAILAFFTYWLWSATRRLAIDTQRTDKRQLRAYVSVRGTEVHGDAAQPRFTVELVNCGQTPAHEMTAWIGSAFRDFPLNGTLSPLESPSHKQSLGPSVPSLLRKALKRGFLPEEIQQMRDNTHALYIFGRCNYKDIFGEAHFTDFRFAYRDTIGEAAGMQRYKEGNDSD